MPSKPYPLFYVIDFFFKKLAFLETCMEWKPFCAHLPKLRSILLLSPLQFSFPLLDQLQLKCPRNHALLYQHSFLLFHSRSIRFYAMYKIYRTITNFTQCKGNVDSIIYLYINPLWRFLAIVWKNFTLYSKGLRIAFAD